MDDLERRISRLETRAENIDDMPLLDKAAAASLLFKDMIALMVQIVLRIRTLEGRAHG